MFSIHTFDELASTNDYLKEHYQRYVDKSVICATKQTKGRGRFDRVWESTSDLTFSILFKEAYPQEQIAPLAVIEALAYFGIDAMIKWPNDIILQDKKLGGILIEHVYDGNRTACYIVGIGINLTKVDTSLESKACYVALDTIALLNQILLAYETIMQKTSHEIIALYQTKNYLKGRKIRLHGVLWEVGNITSEGYLQVCNETKTQYLKSEEVTLQQIY